MTGRPGDSPGIAETAKERAIEQWTAEPAGANLAAHARGDDATFYSEVERTRYHAYPWLLSYLTPDRWSGKRVLEVGVGLGTDHLMLHRAGATVSGVDLTPASIEHSTRRLTMHGLAPDLHLADAEHLPFADQSFDAAYSFGVLHHTPDMPSAIRELRRVLRDGGTAVVALYNRRSYFAAWRLARHVLRGEFRHFSLEQMKADFEYGDGQPLVILSTRRELEALFADFSSVSIEARHLPTNRVSPRARRRLDALLRPLERRIGWYWMIEARR
jgi:SAM-dependent methyltransferase